MIYIATGKLVAFIRIGVMEKHRNRWTVIWERGKTKGKDQQSRGTRRKGKSVKTIPCRIL